ncbi:hypothetical protein [Granulicella sp. S190]|uniref:hypothetical protein n=1 Tax=Granulicella sp. S190 TaxID=1747226 RepID=UPI00131C2CB0|nr:hypothetical protein [Granulicella sp. S190]
MTNGSGFNIPETFNFNDLGISRNPTTGNLNCLHKPLEELLAYNGIDARRFRDRSYFKMICMSAITECYKIHLSKGGKPNPFIESSYLAPANKKGLEEAPPVD